MFRPKTGKRKNRIFRAEKRALMLGLDASGKTTILYKLKLGEVVTTIPTIGFNVETVELRTGDLTVWDVGGQEKIRPLWRHYTQATQVFIWVVDAADRGQFDLSKREFMTMLNNSELTPERYIIIANKQDLPAAASVDEVEEALDLKTLLAGKDYTVVPCDMTSDMATLYDALGSKGVRAPARRDADDEEAAEIARVEINNLLFRTAVFVHDKLGLPYVPTVKALRFGRVAEGAEQPQMPAEILSRILEFVELSDLVPRGMLARRYQRVYPQGCWLASRTFMTCAFVEIAHRVSLYLRTQTKQPTHPLTNPDATFDVKTTFRALLTLQVPEDLAPLHLLATAAMCVSLQRASADDGALPTILRLDPGITFVDCPKVAPGALKQLHRVMDFLTASLTALDSRVDESAPTLEDLAMNTIEPSLMIGGPDFGDDNKIFFRFEDKMKDMSALLVQGLHTCSVNAAEALLAYLQVYDTICRVAPDYSVGIEVPAVGTLQVAASPGILHGGPAVEKCIRTENYRMLEVDESERDVWLSMAEVEAVLDVVRGRVTNGLCARRCLAVKVKVREDLLPMFIAAACEVEGRRESGSPMKLLIVELANRGNVSKIMEEHNYQDLLNDAGIQFVYATTTTLQMVLSAEA
jgi:small GTP-binding protein